MNPVLRNVLGLLLGLIVGAVINGLIINISGLIIPPPEGLDVKTMEGLKAGMHLMEPRHFIMPFLAHAIGTLVGAFIAAKVCATRKMTFAIATGFVFLIGGTANVIMLPSPIWFTLTDLILAYIPMGWLGGKLAGGDK